MRKVFAAVALLALTALPMGARAAATQTDGYITSFDGTRIIYHLFTPEGASAEAPVPLILRTHGWGGSGEASVAAGGTLERLLQGGYAVLTWDQRGFGRSGGQAQIDDPAFEGRDVSALLDMAAAEPEIKKVDGDPVVGMTGGSYAGAIQFSASSIDGRIDAIAPEIAWNDLPQALFPNNVSLIGWDTLLYGVGQTGYRGYIENGEILRGNVGTLHPVIHTSLATGLATNDPSLFYDFFAARSVARYVGRVGVPALVIQGTTDTLFPLQHGFANAAALRANGQPVKMVLFNGGHTLGSNIPAGDARTHLNDAILNWFAKYLKGEQVDTGPDVEAQDQTAAWRSYSFGDLGSTRTSSGTVENLIVTPAPTGGGAVATGNPNISELSGRIPLTGLPAGGRIIGVPTVSGTITGAAPDAFLFFKLVDVTTNTVIDDQVTPYRAWVLPDQPASFSIGMNGVSWTVEAGHEYALEISTGSAMYANSRVPGIVSVSATVDVPVA